MMKHPATECEVAGVWSIDVVPCQGMSSKNIVEIQHMASIRLSIRDGTRSVEGEYEFMVFPGSTEDLVLAKPQLDDLGFRSTKHEICLEALGLSFPAVLPKEHASTLRGESVMTLKADGHRAITPPRCCVCAGMALQPYTATMGPASAERR